MKKVIVLIIIVISVFPLYGESKIERKDFRNTVSLNFDSGTIFTSISLERKLFFSEKIEISGQIGIGTIPYIWGLSFPHKLLINIISNKYISLELGAGGNFWSEDIYLSTYSYYIYPVFGFRVMSDYPFVFRINFSPYINIYGEDFFSGYNLPPLVGVSLGYLF